MPSQMARRCLRSAGALSSSPRSTHSRLLYTLANVSSGAANTAPVFMRLFLWLVIRLFSPALLVCIAFLVILGAGSSTAPIRFQLQSIPFRLEHGEVVARHVPATMAGGIAVFDYNRDGRPDIFFTNGANLATLKKDDPKYRNRLFRNDGHGSLIDVTDQAGVAGTGFDTGAAVGDYDNDGYPDLFVAGVHHST